MIDRQIKSEIPAPKNSSFLSMFQFLWLHDSFMCPIINEQNGTIYSQTLFKSQGLHGWPFRNDTLLKLTLSYKVLCHCYNIYTLKECLINELTFKTWSHMRNCRALKYYAVLPCIKLKDEILLKLSVICVDYRRALNSFLWEAWMHLGYQMHVTWSFKAHSPQLWPQEMFCFFFVRNSFTPQKEKLLWRICV